MALCEQECAGAVLTELQDEESVWAEPVDEGLLCWNCIPEKQKDMVGKIKQSLSAIKEPL